IPAWRRPWSGVSGPAPWSDCRPCCSPPGSCAGVASTHRPTPMRPDAPRRCRSAAAFASAGMLVACLLMALAACRSVETSAPPLRVMGLNVRLPLESDGANLCARRRGAMAGLIDDTGPDRLGTQELMRTQADELAARLPDYGWFGVGRRGGDQDEHMGVFYRRDTMRLLDSGHFWLSATPEQPGSISWGHPYPRMVSWGLFERRADGLRLRLLNTHLPYRPEDGDARLRGAALIQARLATFDD